MQPLHLVFQETEVVEEAVAEVESLVAVAPVEADGVAAAFGEAGVLDLPGEVGEGAEATRIFAKEPVPDLILPDGAELVVFGEAVSRMPLGPGVVAVFDRGQVALAEAWQRIQRTRSGWEDGEFELIGCHGMSRCR